MPSLSSEQVFEGPHTSPPATTTPTGTATARPLTIQIDPASRGAHEFFDRHLS